MKKFYAAVAGLAMIAVAAPTFADQTNDAMKSGAMKADSAKDNIETYTFAAQNGSGETGKVTLKAVSASSTSVTVALTGAPTTAQPAHIHKGTCSKLDPKPAYPLTTVVDGKSTTVVNVPLEKLTSGSFAVNVHKSTNDIATYVSCANLADADDTKAPASKM